MSVAEDVSHAVDEIRGRIAAAARAAGRHADEITLVAVCKKQPFERIAAAWRAGLRQLGENTAQGMIDTAAGLEREHMDARWHFVGALQRNKINAVLPFRPLVHSIDRRELAEALAKRAGGPAAAAIGGHAEAPVAASVVQPVVEPIDVLVQVNIGREPQKGGVAPEAALELAEQVAALTSLRLRGLMAIPPAEGDPRPHFEALRLLSEALQKTSAGRDARELSMGMSDDFEVAVACGATIVRIGTALFGERRLGHA